MNCSLKDFLQAFASEHALTGGGQIVLDISPHELAALGDYLVRGLCGWALGLEADRALPRLVEVTPTSDVADNEPFEQQIEDEDQIH